MIKFIMFELPSSGAAPTTTDGLKSGGAEQKQLKESPRSSVEVSRDSDHIQK